MIIEIIHSRINKIVIKIRNKKLLVKEVNKKQLPRHKSVTFGLEVVQLNFRLLRVLNISDESVVIR
jgi:hypothetical protein